MRGESVTEWCQFVYRVLCSAQHSRTQHTFDSIHTTHLLFLSAYKSAVHVSSSSDTAVGVCVCAGGKISRPYSHASDIARVIACAGCLALLSPASVTEQHRRCAQDDADGVVSVLVTHTHNSWPPRACERCLISARMTECAECAQALYAV